MRTLIFIFCLLSVSGFCDPIKSIIGATNTLFSEVPSSNYIEVEYIESTGTQWIDTGYSYDSETDEVHLRFELTGTTLEYKWKWIFGAYDSVKRLGIGSGDNQNRRTVGYNTRTSYNLDKYFVDFPHEYVADFNGVSIDGTKFFGFEKFATISNILLFSIPLQPDNFSSKSRIFEYAHIRNGDYIVVLRPIRFTNIYGEIEGAMYDIVSCKLFRNQGIGEFIIGPDKE